jgi:3-hydroxyisobutyrate dehydrogenase
MKAGFIGLGNLGRAMAQRLVDQNVQLTVWNRTSSKARGLAVDLAETPADVVAGNRVIFLNLFDSDAVREVLTGQNGILKAGCREKIVIDTSTNHPEVVGSFHAALGEQGGSYLESPVLGSVVPASRGKLTVLASGDRNVFEECRPFLSLIGEKVFYLGNPGLATRMKLVNNMVLGAFMATLAEAVAFAVSTGINKEDALSILSAGAGSSGVLDAKKQKLILEDFSPHFSVAAIIKDLRYLENLAEGMHRQLIMPAASLQLFERARGSGLDSQDFSAVFSVLK